MLESFFESLGFASNDAEWLDALGSIASALMTLAALLFAGYELRVQTRQTTLLRQAEMHSRIQERFDALAEARAELFHDGQTHGWTPERIAKRDQLMVRFWSLQAEQFAYYAGGAINEDIYVIWLHRMAKRAVRPRATEILGGETVITYWRAHGRALHVPNRRFVRLIDSVLAFADKRASDDSAWEDPQPRILHALRAIARHADPPGRRVSGDLVSYGRR